MNQAIARALLAAVIFATAICASAATINIQVDKPGHKVAPTLWGVFFEDINLSADGGIYPELVRNRSFEDSEKPENWSFANPGGGTCEAVIDSSKPLNPLNRRSLRVKLDGTFTLEKGGYHGMGINQGETYTFKGALRGDKFSGPVTIKVLSAEGREFAAGRNNTQHGVEYGETLDGRRGSVETGRWYDIKLEVKGHGVKCWLDGKVIHDISSQASATRGLFASAVHGSKIGDIIVKVVNAAAGPTETEINLNGMQNSAASAEAIVLTSEDARDENTLDEPMKVSPKSGTLKLSGNQIRHAFPGNSLTVIRVKPAP